jgi:hypothetical protein
MASKGKPVSAVKECTRAIVTVLIRSCSPAAMAIHLLWMRSIAKCLVAREVGEVHYDRPTTNDSHAGPVQYMIRRCHVIEEPFREDWRWKTYMLDRLSCRGSSLKRSM